MTCEPGTNRDTIDQVNLAQDLDVLNIVLDNLTQGMVVVGVDYRVLAFNRYFEKIFQLPPGTVETGIDFREILKIWAKATGQNQQMLDHAIFRLDEPTPFDLEFPQLILGESRWCLLTHNPIRGKGFVRTFTDITKRKQMEETLRRDRAMLARTENIAHIGSWEWDVATDTVTWSEEMFRILQRDPSAGTPSFADQEGIYHPEDMAQLKRAVEKTLREGTPYEIELRPIRLDGETRVCMAQGIAELGSEGKVTRLFGSLQDVTESKGAEETLRQAHQFNEQIIMNAQEGIIVYGPDLEYQIWNPFMEQFSGLPAGEVVGKHPLELFPFLKDGGVIDQLEKVLAGGLVGPRDFPFNVLSTGRSGWASDINIPLRNAKGEITGVIGMVRDITDRKLAEEALLASQEKFFKVFNSAPILISLTNLADGRLLEVNDQYCKTIGYTRKELLGKTTLELGIITPEDRAKLIEVIELATGTPKNIEFLIRSRTGLAIPILLSGSLIEAGGQRILISMVLDITEQKRVEEEKAKLQVQLQQSQKMESLGVLAGGVAHDMNNVLGAILGLASAFADIQPADTPAHGAFDTILKAATRGGARVKSLLAFARQTLPSEQKLDLNAIIQDEVRTLVHTTIARIHLEMDLAENLPPILGDASALIHAFMNLCINAVDAMPDSGTLTLRTRTVDKDWIEVVVEDTGTGMPREVLEKAMDPFFTTKEVGKGTGLGLSMVYSTVKAHRGQLEIQSQPGQGTRVRMRFPACEPLVQVPGPAAEPRSQSSTGGLNVLLVDDDELIQSSMQAILAVLGHFVTAALSGEDALANLATGFQPDVVILDMNMPGLGGAGSLPRLRALLPKVPVLLSTGRIDQTALDLAAAYPGVTLLSKPFSIKELEQKLEILGLG